MKSVVDLNLEIEELEFSLLDAKKAVHDCRPQWQEDLLIKEGRYPVGDIPRNELSKRVELIEAKLKRKKKELKIVKSSRLNPKAKRFAHGNLKQEIQRLAKRDGFKTGDSVDGKTRKKWLKEISAGGKTTTDAAIRAELSNLTITKERKP